ncbi:HAL/PAL/TAL family ammonia-lyase [Sinorhizobium meliloti]|uniref:HAL/PAL/TAL family ammonia-lyase n=1 Tax=Rhizobium meliloti TaxID=382 RepID=UPI001F45056A|nr:histidine ammonia-lyase [Sinorhizobium meliloti]
MADVLLNGRNATPEMIVRVAKGEAVAVDGESLDKVERAYAVLLQGAKEGQEIYGLTVGVGWNKDRKMVDATGELTPELMGASREFNEGLLRAHSVGVGPDAAVPVVRAAMAVRLNNILTGGPGVQPHVAEMLIGFLNKGITPTMPSRGSVGQADMTLLSHIGLAMLGEGDVDYQGRRMPAGEALKSAGIEPLKPFGKDGLAILSSNAYAAGLAALAIHDAEQLLSTSRLVYALSLEGLNGNVSPLLEDVAALRPFPSHLSSTAELRALLEGSYLWQADDKRILQDPLSFRTAPYLLGSFADSLARTKALVQIQINSSDDNPGIVVGVEPKSDLFQARRGYVEGGAVLPTANFEPLPWIIAFEELGIVLAHHTTASSERVLKLNNPTHTKLTRYLGTENTHHAFLVVEAPLMALATENRALAQPTSFDSRPIAGGVEDVGTNAPFVVERIRTQIDNSFTILSMELLHAAQAADLRLKEHPERKLSTATASFHGAFRDKVPFLDRDRSMTPDIAAGAAFLKDYALTN